MATPIQLRKSIKDLQKALNAKGVPAALKTKLKEKLEKAEADLNALKKKRTAGATVKSQKPTLDRLQKLVAKAKYSIYKNKGIDLKKDASQPALPSGKRVSQGLKANKSGDKKSNKGNTYYEYRANRVDVKQPPKRYPKLAKGGMMAKGGGIASKTTYVPNRDIIELSITLGNELKKISGKSIVDGVYVKNSALSKLKAKREAKKLAASASSSGVDELYSKIVAKAKEEKIENKYIKENIKKEDIKKMADAGLDLKDLFVLYFGVQTLSPTTDLSYDSSGLMSIYADAVKEQVESVVEKVKNNTFEIGLKYPSISWTAINKKYAISKTPSVINGEVREYKYSDGTTEEQNSVYSIYKGNKVVIGTMTDRIRYINGKLDKDDNYKTEAPTNGNYEGGYWGIVTSSKEIMYDIAKMILSQKNGYVKDIELFANGLGGIMSSVLDLNKVEYEEGGMMDSDDDEINYNSISDLQSERNRLVRWSNQYGSKGADSKIKQLEERIEYLKSKDHKMADGGYMAKGGYVSKGELVWRKLSNVDRSNFLYENFTTEITPASQNSLVGKDFNFLPKKVKIKLEAKYANVEDYANGGMMADGGETKAAKDFWDLGKPIKKVKWLSFASFENKLGYSSEEIVELTYKKWSELPKEVKKALVSVLPKLADGGYMAGGGMMAKGGAVSHGLKMGDKIIADQFWENSVVVDNPKTGRAVVYLETGKRVEGGSLFAEGGNIHRLEASK